MCSVACLVWSRRVIAAFALAGLSAASPSFAQVSTTYVYDAQGQVTGVTRGGATTTYSYDQAANRTAVTASGSLALRSASPAGATQSKALTGQAKAPVTLPPAPAGYAFVPDSGAQQAFEAVWLLSVGTPATSASPAPKPEQ